MTARMTLREKVTMPTLKLPNRIYSQYSDKPKIVDWVNITRRIGEGVAYGAQQVRECYDVDKASGHALEVIGRVVVIDRIKKERLMNAAVFSEPDGTEFGDDKKQLFAPWSTFTNQDLNDEMLRILIRAKIVKNTANPTNDGLLEAFQTIFPSAQVFRIINHHDMSFTIEYTGYLSPLRQWIIQIHDLLPTPQGVRIRNLVNIRTTIEFFDESVSDIPTQFDNEEMRFFE